MVAPALIPTLLAASPSFCSLSDRASALSLMSRQYIRAILHMSCTIEKPMGLSRAAWGPLWCGTLALLMETHLQEQERKCQLLMPVSMASDGSIQCTNLHELHHDHKGFLRVRPVELLPGLHDLGVAGGQVDGGCAVLVVLPKRHQLGGQRKQMQFSLYGKKPPQTGELSFALGVSGPSPVPYILMSSPSHCREWR